MAVTLLAVFAAPALAGQASSGQLFFYPCTSCHPIAPGSIAAGRQLPNGFKSHQIVLEGHDSLGQGKAACLACHEDAAKNPGMLKTLDGSLVEITGDVSLVCARCHSGKYAEWQEGHPRSQHAQVHRVRLPRPPHARSSSTPVRCSRLWGAASSSRCCPRRRRSCRCRSAPRTPKPYTPAWFAVAVMLGVVAAGGIVVKLTQGRSKR